MTAQRDRARAVRNRDAVTDPIVREALRDMDDYMRGTMQWIQVAQFDELYTEPMRLQLEHEPIGIVCVRVRKVPELQEALAAGGICPFWWDGQRSSAFVQEVPGLVTGTFNTQRYRFDFLAVG